MVYIVYMGEAQTSSLTNPYRTPTMAAKVTQTHRLNSQQLRKFEADLQYAQAQSFDFSITNLRRLEAQRDAYLLTLR